MDKTIITGWQLAVNSRQYCEWTFAEFDSSLEILVSSYDEIQHVIDSVDYILAVYRSHDRHSILECIIRSMIHFNNDVTIVQYIHQLWPVIIKHLVDISSFNDLLDAEGYEVLMRHYTKEKLLNGGN